MYNQEQYDSSQMNDLIDCVCGHCNKTVQKTKKRIYEVFIRHKRDKIFCCKVCSDKAKIKQVTLNCLNCQIVFSKMLNQVSENNFCSQSCSAIFNNKKRGRKTVEKKPFRKPNVCEKKECKCCLKEIKNKRTFCSLQCQANFRQKSVVDSWLNGNIKGYSGKTLATKRAIRRFLIEKSEYKCSKCGWSQINLITNKVPLEINHIDGNPLNDKLENLEVLCPNCHSLTPNFRALNKNSPRDRRGPSGNQTLLSALQKPSIVTMLTGH